MVDAAAGGWLHGRTDGRMDWMAILGGGDDNFTPKERKR